MAYCPSHDDKGSRSLSIRQAENGKVLLHCFAGCTFTDIASAVAMSPRQLFPASNPPRHGRRRRRDADVEARLALEAFIARVRAPPLDRIHDELRLVGLLLLGGTRAFRELPAGFDGSRIATPYLRILFFAIEELVRQGTPRRWFSVLAIARECERVGHPRFDRSSLFAIAAAALRTARGTTP